MRKAIIKSNQVSIYSRISKRYIVKTSRGGEQLHPEPMICHRRFRDPRLENRLVQCVPSGFIESNATYYVYTQLHSSQSIVAPSEMVAEMQDRVN